MFRSLTPLFLGAICGTAIMFASFYFSGGSDSEPVFTDSGASPAFGFDRQSQSVSVATVDTEELTGLGRIQRPAERREASLTMLDELGYTLESIVQISDALPEFDRVNFTLAAFSRIAVRDPQYAIQLALGLDDAPVRTAAVREIAVALAELDPRSAYALGEGISNYSLAEVYRSALFEVWAGYDPQGFLLFVESASSTAVRGVTEAFAVAASVAPSELLSMIDRIPRAARYNAEREALKVLVGIDTQAALAHLESLPESSSRSALFRSTAEAFARKDLEAALAWAEGVQPPSSSAMTGVMWVLIKSDPGRGVNLMIDKLQSGGGPSGEFDASSVLQAFTPGSSEAMSQVALRLSSVDDNTINLLYEDLIDDWAANDPDAALSWAFANPDRLTTASVANLARNIGSTRPAEAKQAAGRLPANLQSMWIRVVADELATVDMDDALSWLSQYQGQPVYRGAIESALQSVLFNSNVEDPSALARFLDEQPADIRSDSFAVIANAWAERDPVSAARWVLRTELTDDTESRRLAAISNVAARWAARDAAAAESWAIGLEDSELRDRALGSLLSETSGAGRVEERVLEAFSTNAAAQRSLALSAMRNLGNSDPDLGRELIDRFITDPEMRAQAEERLVEGMSNPSLISGGVVSLR